ncbi:methyltransferase [Brevibacillus reuszeri]|uniref:Methyltransferase n=1 Tax=Brevibacillus reuszeri TaxID=54915 RepID=A0A0K9YJ53_9BACL|nr:class I SAM-dependent methyltransferase [Brevibacillus reuszeri]KNB68691.1 methyltransferase [Brevibacillus reuszeri]MED1858982.1 class I SAM-dependent methyltransferase [Brevibacillus reuszeri]GED69199.1 methyltransferase [Brevibacillus reuszeri]
MNQWSEQASKQWDEYAADWHSKSDAMWETGSRRTILPFFMQLISAQTGPVLDAGCGDGYASCKLAEQGFTVQGVDIAGEMIRLANDRVKSDHNQVHFQTADISSLPFSDATFAGALSINVVEFTHSPIRALLELHRVLAVGGVLVLGILGPTAGPRAHSYRRLYEEATIQNTMMPWEAKQLARENGFTLLAEEPVYKDGITPDIAGRLSVELREAVSFLTLFALQKTAK